MEQASTFTGTRGPATWSGRRVSNPRQSAWKADALPTELRPQRGLAGAGGLEPRTLRFWRPGGTLCAPLRKKRWPATGRLPAEVLGLLQSLAPSGDGSSACPASSRSGEAAEDGRATSRSPGRHSTRAAFGALMPLGTPPCGGARLCGGSLKALSEGAGGVGPKGRWPAPWLDNHVSRQRAWLPGGARPAGPALGLARDSGSPVGAGRPSLFGRPFRNHANVIGIMWCAHRVSYEIWMRPERSFSYCFNTGLMADVTALRLKSPRSDVSLGIPIVTSRGSSLSHYRAHRKVSADGGTFDGAWPSACSRSTLGTHSPF